jgi:hypothetical protein
VAASELAGRYGRPRVQYGLQFGVSSPEAGKLIGPGVRVPLGSCDIKALPPAAVKSGPSPEVPASGCFLKSKAPQKSPAKPTFMPGTKLRESYLPPDGNLFLHVQYIDVAA